MTLIKTSFYTGTSVLIKVIAIFIQTKIVSFYTGPVGLAIIEQFVNFILIIRTFSGNFIQQGVVKYIAEYRDDEDAKTYILSSALIICMTASAILSTLVFCFSAEISKFILQSIEYKDVIRALSFTLTLFSLNSLLIAVLNGELEIRKYVLVNIGNTVLILILTCYLVIYHSIYGGLIALILNQSIILFFTLFLVTRCKWFKWSSFFKGIDFNNFSKFSTYALIMMVTVLSIPVSQIILRKYIGYVLSWQEAGYWQGMMKLSNNYAILVDTTLSVYFLPKLASIQITSELKNEIINGYKFIIPLAILGSICLFLCRKYVVIILFSHEFLPMTPLFKYQLIGDVARIGAWLLSYVMIAKTLVKALFITEFSFLIYYTLLTIIFVRYFGLIGATIGFAISNILYWITMCFFVNKYTSRAEQFVYAT